MSLTILVTGFGPFPGAPFNPTGLLAQRATRARRPALADVKIITHIFPTSYAAVDRELPSLIAKHKPDALLMFGLAPRASTLRVETRARNTLALLPDAGGASLGRWTIAIGKPASIKLRTPDRALLAALRGLRPRATLSRDAGRYLCNYLCWRASETASISTRPRFTTFIHVPPVRRGPRRKRDKALASLNDLTVAGTRALVALVAAARR
jgi:pyroglutamyl-peptidase